MYPIFTICHLSFCYEILLEFFMLLVRGRIPTKVVQREITKPISDSNSNHNHNPILIPIYFPLLVVKSSLFPIVSSLIFTVYFMLFPIMLRVVELIVWRRKHSVCKLSPYRYQLWYPLLFIMT